MIFNHSDDNSRKTAESETLNIIISLLVVENYEFHDDHESDDHESDDYESDDFYDD